MALPRITVSSGGNDVASSTGSLVVGARIGVDAIVDDPIVADRHCEFFHDGAFRVRDLGSVTGTWVDGRRAAPVSDLLNGTKIVIGSSTLVAKVGYDGGTPTLELELERQSFWWKKPSKGTFDNDPDALVRSEVAFGRFPALALGNRLAALAGAVLLVAATFASSVMGTLADAGPLLTAHAALQDGSLVVADAQTGLRRCQEIATAQGCDACHSTGAGATESKCMQCHADMREPATWRHPYLGDGKLGAVPGVDSGEGLCVVCHIDHQGKDWLKPASADLQGKCEACHGGDRQTLLARVPAAPVVEVQRPFAAYHFPHEAHVQKEIACTVCHTIDPSVQTRAEAGLPDDPTRQDYADVPFEICAKCHVPGSLDPQLTLAKDHQWPVRWHGTDEGGKYCAQCHAQVQRDGRTVFGPEFATVARGSFTPAQYAAERAHYTVPTRSHAEQFQAHGQGKDCTVCHLNGSIVTAAAPAPRTFWHALHTAEGALAPRTGTGGQVSADEKQGCLSCHAGLRSDGKLVAADVAAYHWPATKEAQAACSNCHREGDRPQQLAARDTSIAAERRAATPAIAFPHDVHLNSQAFAKSGPLAEGCFACHEFVPSGGADAFTQVPRTKAAAASCVQCHAGHDNVGGNSCKQCHPVDPTRSNSFLVAAAVAPGTTLAGRAQPTPAMPMRAWPRNDAFRHLSPGHRGPGIECRTCHDTTAIGKAKDLGSVPIPNEATPACRECHLQKQFHWR